VHACLLVWRGPSPYIENDSWAIYAILNAACLITVPLLNWSGTLRRLGQKAASLKDPKARKTNGVVGTRAIVIYWAFLVLVGFISIWQYARYGEGDRNTEYPDMSKVMCNPGTNGSKFLSPNGTFHRRAIDSVFIQDNGCTDPCNLINIPSIFRKQNELTLLPHSQALLWNFTIPGPKYIQQEKLMTIENGAFSLDYWTLPFIVLQGFITACFGRRDPREIRDLIYISLCMERPMSDRRWLRGTHEGAVRVLAGFNYLIACAVVLFCAPLFVVSIVAQELQLWHNQPDSENAYQVGQWSSWVYTALVILAALIARYHDNFIGFICDCGRHVGHSFASCFTHHRKRRDHEPEHSFPSVTEKPLSDASTSSKVPDRPTSIQVMPSKRSSTLKQEDNKPSRGVWKTAIRAYREGFHPLNQTGNGPVDEMRNFSRWCRNPQEVSRMVIRHPTRQRDTKFIDAPPAVVDASKNDPRAQDQGTSFFRGASIEHQRSHV